MMEFPARRVAVIATAALLIGSLGRPSASVGPGPALAADSGPASTAAPATGQAGARPALIDATLLWVIDGDTVCARIAGRVERVRYIGIDAPETRHPGRGRDPGGLAATEANRRLVEGQPLHLELDVAPRDRYGRVLAYVYAGERLVNAELVRQGYARTTTVPPNVRYERVLRRLQQEARDQGRGLWAAAPADGVSARPAPGSAGPGYRARPAPPRCR